MSFINWIKNHKLVVILLVVVLFLIYRQSPVTPHPYASYDMAPASVSSTMGLPVAESPMSGLSVPNFSSQTNEKSSFGGGGGRMVIQNSNLSLLVKNVRESADQLLNYTKEAGGFMVTSSYNQPEESPFATVTVRVPTDKLDESLNYFRGLAVKVTSENLVGTDVTEEYTDISARLETLQATQRKFKEILEKATAVQDILTVQREIINTQSQIDALVGQKQALEKNTQLTRITVYLSTDELALPYAPDKAFRPNLIFKQAVRSMFGTLQWIGQTLIWIGVYSVVWVPVLLAYMLFRKWRQGKTTSPS